MPTEKQIIAEFRATLEAWAKQHELKITNIRGWTDKKIAGMALDIPRHRCCCAPASRTCPCLVGVREARNDDDSMCLCSVFEDARR